MEQEAEEVVQTRQSRRARIKTTKAVELENTNQEAGQGDDDGPGRMRIRHEPVPHPLTATTNGSEKSNNKDLLATILAAVEEIKACNGALYATCDGLRAGNELLRMDVEEVKTQNKKLTDELAEGTKIGCLANLGSWLLLFKQLTSDLARTRLINAPIQADVFNMIDQNMLNGVTHQQPPSNGIVDGISDDQGVNKSSSATSAVTIPQGNPAAALQAARQHVNAQSSDHCGMCTVPVSKMAKDSMQCSAPDCETPTATFHFTCVKLKKKHRNWVCQGCRLCSKLKGNVMTSNGKGKGGSKSFGSPVAAGGQRIVRADKFHGCRELWSGHYWSFEDIMELKKTASLVTDPNPST